MPRTGHENFDDERALIVGNFFVGSDEIFSFGFAVGAVVVLSAVVTTDVDVVRTGAVLKFGTFNFCPTDNVNGAVKLFITARSFTGTEYFRDNEYSVSPAATVISCNSTRVVVFAVGAVAGRAGTVIVCVAAVSVTTGTFNFCPTDNVYGATKLFSFINSSTVVPYICANEYNVSPAATVISDVV